MSKVFLLIPILVVLGLAACDTDKEKPLMLGDKLTSETLSDAVPSTVERTTSDQRQQVSNEGMQHVTLESD